MCCVKTVGLTILALTQSQMSPMTQILEVREERGLQRVVGGSFLLLSALFLPITYMIWSPGAFGPISFLFVVFGLFLGVGLTFAFGSHTPRVRLRVSDQGIWMLPDRSDWFLLRRPHKDPVTLSLQDLVRMDDGGVLYGYRRLSVVSTSGISRINTTFLDTDLRAIVARIHQQLEGRGKGLVEQGLDARARSGVWHVEDAHPSPSEA